MNLKIQKKLCAIARYAGTELNFTEGMPIRFYGCQHTNAPIAVINSDRPQCEQIFTALHEIGHFIHHYQKDHKLPIPSLINRPYENEFLSAVTYRAKRIMWQKFNSEWQADLWALCAFCALGCPQDLQEFLRRHPEKLKLMLLMILVMWQGRLVRAFKKLLGAFIPKSKTA